MVKQNWIKITSIVSFVIFLAACNQVVTPSLPDEALAPPASTAPVVDTQTASEMTQPTPPPGMEFLIEKAREDLAQRLSIGLTQISLVEARAVVWPDSSLGCPQPGMRYLQVPEDGALIRLQVGDQLYPYHSGGFREPFLCEQTGKDPNPPTPIDIFNLTPSSPKSTPDTPTTPDNSIPPGEDQ
jgi:hypothetical protein